MLNDANRAVSGDASRAGEKCTAGVERLGCVFTQHTRDRDGHPLRDPASTTYLCGLENAEDFWGRLRLEALRRGMGQSQRTVLLGDGAAWVWEVGRVSFRQATEILDYYHAREHLSDLMEAVVGLMAAKDSGLLARWEGWLWEGQVDRVVHAARRYVRLREATDTQALETQVSYFERNRSRLRYGEFRRQGLFIGSGVVEAGCETVIGQRAKQSGMRWSETGVLNVLHTRCTVMGGQFEACWSRRPQRQARALAA